MIDLSVLRRRSRKGPVSRFSRLAASGSWPAWMGMKNRALEVGLGAEEAGVEELHDRPQVADVVFDRGAGEGDAVVARQRACGLRLLRFGVLDVLRLVEDDAGPVYFLENVEVAVEQGVAGEDESVLLRLLLERGAFLALTAVVNQDRQIGREALRFLVPVADDGHGADEQHRSPAIAFPVALDEGERLHGLAETHVVGQAGAQARTAQEAEPGVAAHLVRTQRAVKPCRR